MKKALSLVLAVVLAFGMCTVAFAAKKDVQDIKGTDLYYVESEAFKGNGNNGYDHDTKPDETIKLWLNPYNFHKDDLSSHDSTVTPAANAPAPVFSSGAMTTSNLSTQKITVRRNITKGSDLLNTIEFDQGNMPADAATQFNNSRSGLVYPTYTNGTSVSTSLKAAASGTRSAYIKVEMVEHFVSVNDKDFEYKIYLYLDGSKKDDTEIIVSGTMVNEDTEVYEDDDYVSSEDGLIVKPQDYIRNIKMYLGDGVTAHLNMFSGTKYYGTARQEVSSADDAVINQYPEIETVYVLRTVNVKSASTKVTFDVSDTYYVYNADGEYIGTTAEQLPYSDKYYLAISRITMGGGSAGTEEPAPEPDGDDDDDDDTTPTTPDNPDMGGDDGADDYTNVNDNPGTGVNGLVSVAIVAGVVALAAAGAVSLKK